MNKDVKITRYESFLNETTIDIVVGFTIALKNEEGLPELPPNNTTFYVEGVVSKDLTEEDINQEEVINQAWLQVKQEVEIKTEKLINQAEQNLLGQIFNPPSN